MKNVMGFGPNRRKTCLFFSSTTQVQFKIETSFKVQTSHKNFDFIRLNIHFDLVNGFYTITVRERQMQMCGYHCDRNEPRNHLFNRINRCSVESAHYAQKRLQTALHSARTTSAGV